MGDLWPAARTQTVLRSRSALLALPPPPVPPQVRYYSSRNAAGAWVDDMWDAPQQPAQPRYREYYEDHYETVDDVAYPPSGPQRAAVAADDFWELSPRKSAPLNGPNGWGAAPPAACQPYPVAYARPATSKWARSWDDAKPTRRWASSKYRDTNVWDAPNDDRFTRPLTPPKVVTPPRPVSPPPVPARSPPVPIPVPVSSAYPTYPNLPVGTTVMPDGSLRLSNNMLAARQPDGSYQTPDGTRFRITSLTTPAPPAPSTLSPKATAPEPGRPPFLKPIPNSGLVVQPDNSVKLPDGSVLNTKGELLLPDGTISLPDAQRGWWRMIDGSALLANGSIQIPPSTVTAPSTQPSSGFCGGGKKKPEAPASPPPQRRLAAAPAGTYRYTDGTLKFPNGLIQRGADRALILPDGSTKGVNGQVASKTGTAIPPTAGNRFVLTNGMTLEPDNSLTLPNGCRKMLDGTVTIPGGAVLQRDGRVRQANGNVTLPDSQGRVVIDASGATISPDLTLTSADGMEKRADGTTGRASQPASVNRPVMGIELKPCPDPAMPSKSVLSVYNVAPGGPTERAGLRPGDILRTWDNTIVDSEQSFASKISSSVPNQTVLLTYSRGAQNLWSFMVLGGGANVGAMSPTQTRTAPPSPPPQPLNLGAPGSPPMSPKTAALRPTVGMNIQMADDIKGNPKCVAVVQSLVPGGPAAQAGIQVNDVLVSWDGRLLNSYDAVMERVRAAVPGAIAQIGLNRQNEGRTVAVKVGSAPVTPAP